MRKSLKIDLIIGKHKSKPIGTLYSYDDRNNEIVVNLLDSNQEPLPNLNNGTAKILSVFEKTKAKYTYNIELSNAISFEFNTSLITEDDVVTLFVYLEEENKTTDLGSFKLRVKLSEIHKDRDIKNERVDNSQEIPNLDEIIDGKKLLTIPIADGRYADKNSTQEAINNINESMIDYTTLEMSMAQLRNGLTLEIDKVRTNTDNSAIVDLQNTLNAVQSQLSQISTQLVRHAPSSYSTDLTSEPWTHWFNNGCGLQLTDGTNEYLNGVGVGTVKNYQTSYHGYCIPLNILNTAKGHISIENWKEIKQPIYWSDGMLVLNPVRPAEDYDWTNARLTEGSGWEWERQRNVLRIMYQMGIWDSNIVENFGAVRR